MSITSRFTARVVLSLMLVVVVAGFARAERFKLAATGTISNNASSDSTIAIGTPWSFELTYDTAAPDLDFELLGSADPTFGRFKNTAAPPALLFFHYRAGGYEVTLDDPADFGGPSDMIITFTSVHALDINIHSPALFPPLAGGPVSFHADFNAFSAAPIFSSDGLPTNINIGPASFDLSEVNLLPAAGFIGGSNLTSLTLTAVPEPTTAALGMAGVMMLAALTKRVRLGPDFGDGLKKG